MKAAGVACLLLLLLLAIASVDAFAPSSSNSALRPSFVPTEAESPPALSSTSLSGKRNIFSRRSEEGGPKADISHEDVRSLFYLWNDALATGDSRIVAARYASDAVLLPTVSDTPRTDPDGIKDYFDAFLLKKPQGTITDGNIMIGEDFAQDAGIYEFTMGATGDRVRARYTFVYAKEDGKWKISHHHSSVMPESTAVAQPITEREVRDLFYLWNDALATLDSDAVARRYSGGGVLLPTVSDTPRTSYALIRDYFDSFLLKKPQGEILESNVLIGTNWAQDAGIYEFTMGATGDKVKGRYSFVYVYEDGEWRISHHHSSVMPEGIPQTKQIGEQQAKNLFYLWNDALATLDSEAVANRYSKNAVLLPTVSDTPRTSGELIKDYFVDFLKKKPRGVILESNVITGHSWAQDAGIYEFTMGADGSKVKARYSFIYVYEDGQWKISHHHSSVMPEGYLGAAPAPGEADSAAAAPAPEAASAASSPANKVDEIEIVINKDPVLTKAKDSGYLSW